MSQPLVTRPAYGHGGSSVSVGESQLPSAGPGGKGLPLDSSIPGTSTFAKPVGDIREQRKDDENVHRVDDADDLLKDRSRIDVREDNADKHDGIGEMGKGKWDTTNKTKWPYREDRHHNHYASSIVVERFLGELAPELVLTPGKVAARLGEILQGASSKVLTRASTCKVTVKRVDVPNLRWLFLVDSGNGAKVVRLKAERLGNATKLSKMELKVSCSCPAWQWQGPEFHAKSEGYLDGGPRGTASSPDVNDPQKHNRVCKHVAAVLSMVKTWEIPKKK